MVSIKKIGSFCLSDYSIKNPLFGRTVVFRRKTGVVPDDPIVTFIWTKENPHRLPGGGWLGLDV